MKIKIEIPMIGYNSNQKEYELTRINNEYDDKFIFEDSRDDVIHFEKTNSKENIFAIIIDVRNMTRLSSQDYCQDVIHKYKQYSDCEFIYLPSVTEESKIVKLTETDKEVELLF